MLILSRMEIIMKKIFREITASVVCGAMCLSLVPASSNESDTVNEIVFSESFNSYATYAEAESLDVSGALAFVEEYDIEQKGLGINLSNGASELEIGASLTEKFFVSFDISASDKISASLSGRVDGDSKQLLTIKKGMLYTHDGMDIASIGKKLTNITIALNTSSSTYDVYIGGKCIYSNYYMSGLKDNIVESIILSLSSDAGAKVIIDNVNVVNGSPVKLSSKKINTKYQEDEYNPEMTEKYDASKKLSDDVYMKQDFSTEHFEALYHGKDNRLERFVDDEGNAWCIFERTGVQDFHLDMTVASYPSSSVVYEFDVFTETGDVQFNSTFKSSNGDYFSMVKLLGSKLTAGEKSQALNVGKWHTVSAVYHIAEAKYDVYVDYKLLAKDMEVPIEYKEKEADIWRIHVNRSSGADKFRLDNIKIYGGAEPRKDIGEIDVVIDDRQTVFEKEGTQRNFLKNKAAYHLRSGVLYCGGRKWMYDPVIENGVSYVPGDFFANAFGCEISENKSNHSVSIDNMTFTADSGVYIKGTSQANLVSAPKLINERVYVPLREVAVGVMGKKIYVDNSTYSGGMVILADDEIKIGKGVDVQKLNDFVLFRRPERDDILAEYEKSPLYGKHPRVLADSSDFDRIRKLWQTDAQMKSWINSIIGSADSLCEETQPLVYELRDGVRLLYVSRDLEANMRALGMAYQMTGDKKYANRAYIDMEAVAKFHSWHPDHDIDVGEMAAGFAIGYDWMYDAYTPEQLRVMEDGARNNGIIEYVNSYQGRIVKLGVVGNNNHNMIVNGGAAMLGVAMMDVYPESSAYLVAGSLRGVEYSIDGYIPDGAWYEGVGYAGLALEFLSQHLCCVEKVFGTCYGLADMEGIDKIAYYFLNMQSKFGSFGFGDGSGGGVTSEPGCLWLCNYFGDAPAATTYKEIVGLSGDWRTILWYRPEMLNSKELVPLDAHYESQDVFVTRDTWDRDKQSTFAGLKGGAANHGHAHGDIGKFEFFANGVQWTTESGGLNYNAPDYWNWHGGVGNGPAGKRWQYWGTRGEAHNTLIIDPDSQFEFDPFEKATLYHTQSKPRGSIAIINSTPVHRGKALSAERGMMLVDDRRSLVVRDEVTVAKPCKVYWNMYTAQDAKLSDDGKSVVISERGNPDNRVTLDFACDTPFEITVGRPELLPNSPNNEYNKLDTHTWQIRVCIDVKTSMNLTAKLTPATVENGKDISCFDVPMTQWTIPDGAIPELPHLDSLVVDGIECNPNDKVVSLFVAQSKTEVPEIVATSEKYNVVIDKGATLDDTTIITVSDKADNANKSTYKIRFNILKSTGVAGVEERDIISVTASEEPQLENPVKNVLDRDLSSRWSAENEQHIIVDLGKVVDFDTVIMAFMSGNGRYYNLKMSVSEDNDSYKAVYSGTSSGLGDGYEKFDVGMQKARYVKIEGAGHKEGTWNSWTEIAIAKKK